MSNAAIKMLRDLRSFEHTVMNLRDGAPETFYDAGSAERVVRQAGTGPCGHGGIGFWALDMRKLEETWEAMAKEQQAPHRANNGELAD